jgi:hypothetical protein
MTTTKSTADRYSNRAPKGGAVSPVNGRFYLGGQWMPMVHEVVEVRPATLEGSSRQVVWASRIRSEGLARLEDEINARLLFLSSPKDAASVRPAIRRLLIARHGLMTERSAARVIEHRAEMV